MSSRKVAEKIVGSRHLGLSDRTALHCASFTVGLAKKNHIVISDVAAAQWYYIHTHTLSPSSVTAKPHFDKNRMGFSFPGAVVSVRGESESIICIPPSQFIHSHTFPRGTTRHIR
jgi:hypothetical protein